MVYTGLRRDKGKALFAVGALMLPQTIGAGRQTSGWFERVELAAGYFKYTEPQVAIRCVARECKLQ